MVVLFILAAAKSLQVKDLKQHQCSEQAGPVPLPSGREQGRLGAAPGQGIQLLPGHRDRLRPGWDISPQDQPRDPHLHLRK